MIVHFSAHISKWELVCKFGVIFPILNISCFCSVLPKVFWAPVLRTSGSWNSPVRNFNNYYVLLIHVFDGCSNRLDPCDHFNLVCSCLSPVLIKGHVERFRKVSNPYDWMLKCSYRFKKINQCCRDACQISEQLDDSKRLCGKLRQDFLCDIESAPRPV